MFLHKLLLDMRCKEVRRDMSDPYEMHSTLCRAFASSEHLSGFFQWRLEPEFLDNGRLAKVLVQSCLLPDWKRINLKNWLGEKPEAPINIAAKLNSKNLYTGQMCRFRLRANPSVCQNKKRVGLYSSEQQNKWLMRQGERNGFSLISSQRSEELLINGKKRSGNEIKVFSVLFEGTLNITDVNAFNIALYCGIGHGKALGLGLFSVMPFR